VNGRQVTTVVCEWDRCERDGFEYRCEVGVRRRKPRGGLRVSGAAKGSGLGCRELKERAKRWVVQGGWLLPG
jgi:hypothetical protein